VLDLANGSSGELSYSKETTTIISFDINSAASDKIVEGIYTYSSGNTHTAFMFEDSFMYTHLIYQDGNLTGGDHYDEVKTVVIIVSYPNGKVKLEYAISFADDVELTGTYEGKVVYYNFELKKV